MNKRVTIYDVASKAGVSTATVSYILNNRTDMKISDTTREKVWQIINLLNYKPSVYAKNLRGALESKLVAFYAGNSCNVLRQAETLRFLEKLSGCFRQLQYGLVLANQVPEKIIYADAIVACDISREEFFELGNQNFIPLVALDCKVNDELFFQITTDYAKLKALADAHFQSLPYTYVCLKPLNKDIRLEIEETFPRVSFLDSLSPLSALPPDAPVFINQSVLYDLFRDRKNMLYTDNQSDTKMQLILDCIKKALSHEVFPEHSFQA